MNTKLRSTLAVAICLAATACTTTTALNPGSSLQQKISTVRLNQLSENISYELAGSNLNGKTTFDEILETTNVMNANNILKNALEHSLEDGRFGENVIINSSLATSTKIADETPVLTPSIVMSANYAVVDIFLTTVTGPDNKNVYFSQQVIESDAISENKDANKQYWLDNPIVLREKILNGLYDVAKQFADGTN